MTRSIYSEKVDLIMKAREALLFAVQIYNKQCDSCGSAKEAGCRPELEKRCFCIDCRQREATFFL